MAGKSNHDYQEKESTSVNDVFGLASHKQHDPSNFQTGDGGLQDDNFYGAEDAVAAVGGIDNSTEPIVTDNFVKDYSRFSFSIFS